MLRWAGLFAVAWVLLREGAVRNQDQRWVYAHARSVGFFATNACMPREEGKARVVCIV